MNDELRDAEHWCKHCGASESGHIGGRCFLSPTRFESGGVLYAIKRQAPRYETLTPFSTRELKIDAVVRSFDE